MLEPSIKSHPSPSVRPQSGFRPNPDYSSIPRQDEWHVETRPVAVYRSNNYMDQGHTKLPDEQNDPLNKTSGGTA